MSLPTPSQSLFHTNDSVNVWTIKRSLRHPLPTFGSFSFFQASLWLGVDKELQILTKSYKNMLKHLFQCYILIPRKCSHKTPFQHKVPPLGFQKCFEAFNLSNIKNFDIKYWNCSFQIQLQEEIDPIVRFEASSFQFLV